MYLIGCYTTHFNALFGFRFGQNGIFGAALVFCLVECKSEDKKLCTVLLLY